MAKIPADETADDNPYRVDPADERRHPAGDELLWNESWYFDFATRDASLGGYVRLGLYPNLGVAWYWACLVGPDRPLVIVADHDVPLPGGAGLEVRHEGLWADHNVEEPVERWSLGLEAFAVSVDDPTEMYRGARGDRVPFGFDLEWETDGLPFNYPVGLTRYEIPCRVHGQVQVGTDTIEMDAVGQRDHSWGVRDWWSQSWCWTAFHLDDGARWHAVTALPQQQGFGYQQHDGRLDGFLGCTVEEDLGPEGVPTSVRLRPGDDVISFAPVAWAPILLTAQDGRTSRFPRGLGTFTTSSGATGVGWLERNQPDG